MLIATKPAIPLIRIAIKLPPLQLFQPATPHNIGEPTTSEDQAYTRSIVVVHCTVF